MEIILLGVVALLLFGPNKLPEIGRQLGKGMRDFRQSLEGTGIKEALDSVNDVRIAVSPVGAAKAFLATDGTGPGEAPVVSGVVEPDTALEPVVPEAVATDPAGLEEPATAVSEGVSTPAEPVEPR